MRQPRMADDDLPVRAVNALEEAPRLPVPEDEVALAVAGREEAPVGAEADFARVARDAVSLEELLPVLPERVRGVDEDGVVEGLAGEPFLCVNAKG